MNRRSALTSALWLLPLQVPAQAANAPHPELAAVQGGWRGKLTYRDYSRPDRLVTLPTRLYVALSAPSELTLHYVFDDGPNKTVFSYDRMAFDFINNVLVWTSGYPSPKTSQNRVTSSLVQDGTRVVAFEREEGGTISRYTLSLNSKVLGFAKEEGTSSAGFQFRNRYEFTRGEA
jgi:hypothetical protein